MPRITFVQLAREAERLKPLTLSLGGFATMDALK